MSLARFRFFVLSIVVEYEKNNTAMARQRKDDNFEKIEL